LGLFVLASLLLAGCGSRATSPAAVPGKEEFGMTMDQLVSHIEAVEASISTCMTEAGFEYIAVDYSTVRRGMVADKSLPGLGAGQFTQQYGYGISTLYTGLAPQVSDVSTPAKLGLGDQNVRIFQSLSPADQVAYSHTLFGEHPDATFAVALETEDFSRTGGCTRRAIEKVFKPEQFSATYLNPFDALVEQDPRMVAASAKYSDCLRRAGFDYNFEREIEPDLRKRLDSITGGLPVDSLSADARAALVELQGYERALAAVAVDCEARFLDPVANQVERELYAGPQQ
jgi:outer membrane murein-binding lipoprotein Lpp